MVDAPFMASAQRAFEQRLEQLLPDACFDVDEKAAGTAWYGREQVCYDGPEAVGVMVARDLAGFLMTRRVVSLAVKPAVVVVSIRGEGIAFTWRFDGSTERIVGRA